MGPSHLWLSEIQRALGVEPALPARMEVVGEGRLPSIYPVTDLATASIGAAALAVADMGTSDKESPQVIVDRRLASLWFDSSIRPQRWAIPPLWDAIAGDYPARDGWIRLHTNAPHHRAAALSVLRVPPEREAVAAELAEWNAADLEAAIVEAGGCAAEMRSRSAWLAHPQGQAVAAEPLVWWELTDRASAPTLEPRPGRPLAGVRVLDLTRVLAGPVATRFLAGYGADVLRIDPPSWDEPGVVPDMTLGKRCARLDARTLEGRARLAELITEADVLVHGYRPGAINAIGFGEGERERLRPGLIDVSLSAYGWTGPWSGRRGFDSLVQMSAGVAEEGMRRLGRDRPTPLPVQALDHATGYLMATAVLRGLQERRASGRGLRARVSLARTAELLVSQGFLDSGGSIGTGEEGDFAPRLETTGWGPAQRLRPPVTVGGVAMAWDRPAGPLGSSSPAWSEAGADRLPR